MTHPPTITVKKLNLCLFVITLLFFAQINTSNAQDTLNFKELIVSSSGKTVRLSRKSSITGSKQMIPLKKGTWKYFDADGNLLKTIEYKVDKRRQMSMVDGEVNYYHPDGQLLLQMRYDNNRLVNSKAFTVVIIQEGLKTIEITEQFGAYTMIEYNTKRPNTQTENPRTPPRKESYETFEKERANPNLLMAPSFTVNHSQNYITNPSIESHPGIYNSFKGIGKKIPGWMEGSPSPDFFIIDHAASGDACLGFRPFSYVNDIEYITNSLAKPLIKDSLYCFSMRVKLSMYCAYATNQIGVYFNDKEGIRAKDGKLTKPSIAFDQSLLMYKTQWMTLQCVYQANGNEKFASIGSFKTFDQIMLKTVKVGHQDEVYYYLDDVSLVPINNALECPCNEKDSIENEEPDKPLKYSTGQSFVLNGVYFENDKSVLLAESIVTLNELVETLRDNPKMIIEIGGHTNNLGGYEHNMDLSLQRAEAVKKFLLEAGINVARLQTKGYGPNNPIATNENSEGQALNRRVEIKILKL